MKGKKIGVKNREVLRLLTDSLAVLEMPDSGLQCQLLGIPQWKFFFPADVHQVSGNPQQTPCGYYSTSLHLWPSLLQNKHLVLLRG